MIEYVQYRRIARLIAAEIQETIKPEERVSLNNWINQRAENRKLYERIRSSSNFQYWRNTREKFSLLEDWEEVHALIKIRNRKERRLRIIQYAAIFLFPVVLLVVGGNYVINQNSNAQELQNVQILTDLNDPCLILDNGITIALDSDLEMKLKELDGTSIQKKGGQLTYIPRDTSKQQRTLYNIVRTPRGGEYSLILEDGTKIFLNAMSQIKYPVKFDETSRLIELSGEAYFEVAHSTIPFVVKTTQLDVTVMGTTFNVNAYENTGRVVTTLVEGKVKVDPKYGGIDSRILLPEEQAVFKVEDQNMHVKKVDISLYTGWKDGQFVFYDMRLEDIMTSLTRWYEAEVSYSDSTIRSMRFSGSLKRDDDFSQILEIIKSTKKVEINLYNGTVIFRKIQ